MLNEPRDAKGVALRAAELVTELLARMNPAERVLRDGTVTDVPKDYTLPVLDWDDEEWEW